MKLFYIFLFFLLISISVQAKEMISTKKGGDWHDSKTWVDGIIPQQSDDVVINSNVKVKSSINCKNIKISKTGNVEFVKQTKTTKSIISENIYLDGKLKIGEKCEVSVLDRIFRDEKAELNNCGIINVGH